MRYILSIFLPVMLLVVGVLYSMSIHRRQFKASHSPSVKEVVLFLLPALIKSSVALFIIILIHNSFHDDHYVELVFFVIMLFVFSIFQSAYSLGGFLTRGKHVLHYSKTFFTDSGNRADRFINRATDILIGKGQIVIKIIIFVSFIIVFIPNITLFISGYILYFVIIVLLLMLAILFNNIVYFGIISLLIFQIDPVSIHLVNANYLVLILSFLVLLLGFSIEDRLEDKMFLTVKVMEVKRFNFKLGYDVVFDKKKVIIYKNIINGYYYVYFRSIGLVVVYHSDFDVKLSNAVQRYMINEAKRFLISNNESI